MAKQSATDFTVAPTVNGVAIGGGGSPTPRGVLKLVDHNNPLNNTTPVYGMAQVENSGTGATTTYSNRGLYLISGNAATIGYASVRAVNQGTTGAYLERKFWDKKPQFRSQFSLQPLTGLTGLAYYGTFDGYDFAVSSFPTLMKCMGFLVEYTNAVPTYYAVSGDTTGQNKTNITSTVTAQPSYVASNLDFLHDVFIDYDGTSIKFYWNGDLVATHTTYLPTGAYGAYRAYMCLAWVRNSTTTAGGLLRSAVPVQYVSYELY